MLNVSNVKIAYMDINLYLDDLLSSSSSSDVLLDVLDVIVFVHGYPSLFRLAVKYICWY